MAKFPKILSRELICWTRECALLGQGTIAAKAVRGTVAGAALMIWSTDPKAFNCLNLPQSFSEHLPK